MSTHKTENPEYNVIDLDRASRVSLSGRANLVSAMPKQIDLMTKEKRTYGPAKIDVKSLDLARKAAALKDQTLADYLSDVVADAARRDLHDEATKIIQLRPKR